MSMIDALMAQARRLPRHDRAAGSVSGRAARRGPAPVEIEQWVWECGRCPDLTPRPFGSEAEAAFLASQHDIAHHGIPLGMPGNGGGGTRPHRIGIPDDPCDDGCATGLQATTGLAVTEAVANRPVVNHFSASFRTLLDR